jgi:hypothetical protein
MSSRNPEIEERIRIAAQNTDKLILRLDTLTGRIDTARTNENQELVEYYERKFAEASVEFMDGVETILDEWYALNGEARPNDGSEILLPETLNEIHSTVVAIVRGLPLPDYLASSASSVSPVSPAGLISADVTAVSADAAKSAVPVAVRGGSKNRLDLKG